MSTDDEATLRDMFAAHALTGLLAGQLARRIVKPDEYQQLASSAYQCADLMMAARDGAKSP